MRQLMQIYGQQCLALCEDLVNADYCGARAWFPMDHWVEQTKEKQKWMPGVEWSVGPFVAERAEGDGSFEQNCRVETERNEHVHKKV